MLQLILGGASSGKSLYAEQLAKNSAKEVIYIATAEAKDLEMQHRIQKHQQQRPSHWQTVEEPLFLAQALTKYAHPKRCLLVDCLTLWLSNSLFNPQGDMQTQVFEQQRAKLIAILPQLNTDIILVSNELGLGVVPMSAMTRKFVEETGKLHQELAQICQRVILVTAGLAQVLK